jgi:hemoglobin
MAWVPTRDDSPYSRLGGEAGVRKLVARFYDVMDTQEPALARLHQLDERGKVSAAARERFTLFLIEWLGGPAAYSPVHGHPRLRMRHGRVPVNVEMRDAWLRCMARAMDDRGVAGEEREFLDKRFAEVADFMRNVPS